MRDKILITGANGFFGKNFQISLKKDFKLYLFKRGDKLKKLSLKNFSYIINCAAEVNNENKMLHSNTIYVEKILKKIINENRNCKLIHFGTSGEYGDKEKKSIETDLPFPRMVYEGTKLAATNLVQSYSKQYNLKSVIIRPFSVFGLWENNTRLVPSIFRHLIFDEKIVIYNGFHDYVYIDDLILFVKSLIKKNRIKLPGEIINFGSGNQLSNFEIFKLCEKNFKKKGTPKINKNFQKIYDKKIWCSDNRYLKNIKKYKFKFNIEKALKNYQKIILKNPEVILTKKKKKENIDGEKFSY